MRHLGDRRELLVLDNFEHLLLAAGQIADLLEQTPSLCVLVTSRIEDGELVFGSMPNARKGADLRRDPRFALHSATVDPVEGAEAQWPGEAKIPGRAFTAGLIHEGPEGERLHAEITEVVHTHLNEKATMLVIEWWTPTHGLRRIERE